MSALPLNDEFKYLVLNTPAGWREGFGEGVRLLPEGGLSLRPGQALAALEKMGRLGGFGLDPRGDLYAIDAEDCRIYRYLKSEKVFEPIFCIGECGSGAGQFRFSPEPEGWAGMALNHSTLYVSDPLNQRVQAFYRYNYQLRYILGPHDAAGRSIPRGLNLPRDLLLDSRGNLYLLDYGHRRVLKFNRFGMFRQIVGEGILARPEGIAIDRDDYLYALDARKRQVLKFDPHGELVARLGDFSQIAPPFRPSGIAVDEQGLIYFGERRPGEDLKIHVLDPSGRYLGSFGEYSEKCQQLLFDPSGNLYAACGSESGMVLINGSGQFLAHGVYYSGQFDSAETGMEWHRITLGATLQEKTKIEAFFYVSDSLQTGEGEPITGQLIEANQWWRKTLSTPQNGRHAGDGLLLKARGRYLWLKLELFGDGAHTPVVEQVRLFFPRLSYLRYLPATYQEEETGRDFLERFLSLYESFSYGMEEQIAQIARYFDPQSTPTEFLNWLGSWLALAADENWPEAKKRELIARAYQLYKKRGTLAGLREMVQLYTGAAPLILEHFRFLTPMVLGANVTVGMNSVVGKSFTQRLILEESSVIGEFVLEENEDFPEKPFEENAFDFTILADTSALAGESQEAALRRLILEEKPAFTRACIRTRSNARMQLGSHTFIGVDTVLSRGFSALRLGAASSLGKQTFVGSRYPCKGIIGARSRLAVDTILW